jgi:LacI family transcriptional regulator
MANLSDVAALAGVSPAAASRVLSGDSSLRVSDRTRERVIAAARQLSYRPNHAGRSLRTSRSSTIALVVPDVTSAVFAELLNGAERSATAQGLAIVLGRAELLSGSGDWLQRMVGEGRFDGIILQLPEGEDPAEVEQLIGTIPLVVINSLDAGPLSTIVLDDAAGIRVAVDHLRALGHDQIGFVGGLAAGSTGVRRAAGFHSALAAVDLDVHEEWVTHLGYTGADGRAAIDLLFDRGPLPTGLVVANLNAALGVLAAIHARNLRVPDHVSIIALHDVWYADATWPPITTVAMPLYELGAAAVARIVDRDGRVSHSVITDPAPRLVVRQSTSAPR